MLLSLIWQRVDFNLSVYERGASLVDCQSEYQLQVIIETVLLSSSMPLSLAQLVEIFSGDVPSSDILNALESLSIFWKDRGLDLKETASGWFFYTKPTYRVFINSLYAEKPPKYSRAVMEVLSIIAYHQPVTRGDIEEIRGVAVSSSTIKVLEERGWIHVVGHKEVPGRPTLLATTHRFLDDLGLQSLSDLPLFEKAQHILE